MVVLAMDVEGSGRWQGDGLGLDPRVSVTAASTPALIRRAANGDSAALQRVYALYSSRVYTYLLRMLRDPDEAEDVTQLVFLRLMSKIHLYREGPAPFHAWLLRMARNVAVDHLRRRHTVPCENIYDENAAGDDALGQRARSLRDAFSTLPPEQRSVVVLRHVVGLSPGETAARLGRSEASIHGLDNRGRRNLRATLTKLDCAPRVMA